MNSCTTSPSVSTATSPAPDGQFDAFDLEGDHMADLTRFADALPTDGAAHLGIEQTTHRVRHRSDGVEHLRGGPADDG